MKFGIRTPSPRKRAAAYGRGRYTRAIKKKLIPGYGKKGLGFLKNPSKATYNKLYRKVTVSLIKNRSKRGTSSKNYYRKTNNIMSSGEYNKERQNITHTAQDTNYGIKSLLLFSLGFGLFFLILLLAMISSLTDDSNFYSSEIEQSTSVEIEEQKQMPVNESNNESEESSTKPKDYITETIINYNAIAEYPVPPKYYDYIVDKKNNSSSYPATFSYRDKDIMVEFSIIGAAKKIFILISINHDSPEKLFPVSRDYLHALGYDYTDEEIQNMLGEMIKESNKKSFEFDGLLLEGGKYFLRIFDGGKQ